MWSQINQTVTSWCQSHPNDLNVPLVVANDLAGGQGDEPKKIAEDLLWRVLQQNPDSRGAIYSLAMLFQTTGRSADAAKLYQRVLSLDPNNVVAVNNLAWILCEDQNQYQQALELAEKGLAKEPNYVDLLDTRGMVYYRLGRFERAVEDFTRCVNSLSRAFAITCELHIFTWPEHWQSLDKPARPLTILKRPLTLTIR